MADEKSRLQNAEEGIYSRGAQDITKHAHANLSPHVVDVKRAWTDDATIVQELTHADEQRRGVSFVSKFFVASVVFFLIASGVAAFMIFGGFNIISSKNVDITIQGPTNVAAGEEVVLEVTIHNNNNTDLENAKMVIEYPEGTREANDLSQDKTRTDEDLGTIPSGGTAVRTVRAVFFGEKDEIKQLAISTDYQAHGSNAHFTKEKIYDMSIKSSPIVVTVDYPKEINANQEINFDVTVTSNSTEIIKDLLLKAEYPFGFIFISANPAPSFDKNVWQIGDLNPKQTKKFTVKGKLEAQNDEERTLRFVTGLADKNDEKKIAVDFITLTKPVTIKKPFIGLVFSLNGSKDAEQSVGAGGKVDATISWTNNLPVTIENAQIEIQFAGGGFDKNTVDPSQGHFISSVNKIVWDKNTVPALRTIGPGDKGDVSFSFSASDLNPASSGPLKNVFITTHVTMSGTRIVSGEPNQNVTSDSQHTVKISSEPNLAVRAVHSIGPFENSGPIPPKADTETTYTIVWTLKNTFNDLGNAIVQAKLPVYVNWKNVVSQQGQVVFDESTRMISWTPGEVKAGVGYTSVAKEVAFQVGLVPSVSQFDTAPVLVGEATLTATDRYTGKQVSLKESQVNTRLNTDPEYHSGDDKVEL